MQRAQSAVEYLTTYSWAIIIIAITLGALYGLGLFSPSAFVSNECIFPADFGCLSGFFYSNGIITLNIEQSTPSPINITSIGCNDQGTATNMNPIVPPAYVSIGSNSSFTVQCYSNGSVYNSQPGALFKGYIVVNYTSLQSGFQHVLIGKIIEKAT